ncbi:related to RNA splicing endonuclease gamma subunit [Sporisorium scitamineum]|uniref:tRNA-splicing endonuclease subunit Sen34 n=1 Tax=Sporisorium scitamineum TaxID=49012 RepID=A0A127ZDL7_9BASI|nr:related to RNA splicing endonuclease gamma subunit [Sporisorium scitamineum]
MSTIAATSTISHLTLTYPGRVQIHLHPSTSLPPHLSSVLSTPTSSCSRSDLPVALVWTVESLRLMRGFGVTGSYTGTLAQFPQQNVFLGLPVQLMPEEVVFLVRRGKAVVVDEARSYRSSGGEERGQVQRGVDEDRRSQQLQAWEERQMLRAKHSSSSSSSQPTEKDLDALPWHYTIPTLSSILPWYHPTTYTTLSTLHPTLYPYPSTHPELCSLALFEHLLSQRGMWCLNGLRFGGTFAAYPGDPLRYHSHYTAQLVMKGEKLGMGRLVANGRLGTAVKKTHLLCCVEEVADGLEEVEEGVRSGRFDVAKKGERDLTREGGEGEGGTVLASFNVFSLAWAGFGT